MVVRKEHSTRQLIIGSVSRSPETQLLLPAAPPSLTLANKKDLQFWCYQTQHYNENWGGTDKSKTVSTAPSFLVRSFFTHFVNPFGLKDGEI